MKTTRKPKPTRNTFTLEALVRQLCRDVPGFKDEAEAVQAALAEMVWIGDTKHRKHSVHEGYLSFHHTEFDKWFGSRQFKAINARLKFLEEKETGSQRNYRYRRKGDDAAANGHTKPYRFSLTVEASRATWFSKRITARTPLTELLDASGKVFRKLPKAIASQDSAGNTTTRWQAINQAGSLSLVPINIASLKQFEKRIGKDAEIWKSTGRAPQDLFMPYPSLEALEELQEMVAKIYRMAHTEIAGRNNLLHHYVESESGRLFTTGTGASLCGVPRELRKAALAGLWDYDVVNCHFAIIAQMARSSGVQCVAIEHYLDNTKEVRHEIAEAVGISYDETKTSLLSVMYGAKSEAWYWYKCAIPDAIGIDAARRLHEFPPFAHIAADVKVARDAILDYNKPNRQGYLKNKFDKSIRVKATVRAKVKDTGKTPEQCLAHLIQGVEAAALEACTELYPQEIILLQHDGFTATKPLDVAALESAIKTATGFTLRLKPEQVFPDLAAQYSKTSKNELSKVRNTLKPNAGAALSPVHMTTMTANSERFC